MRTSILIVSSALLALASSTSARPASATRTLSFEQRVAAQEAIERVYVSHRGRATKSFEEAVPREVLENKVRTYLAQSAALERLWNHSVTGEMLQEEVDRMAGSTSLPQRLRELYSALGNDAFLVQECLARQILVNRLARRYFAYDAKIHEKERQEAELLREDLLNGAIDLNAQHPSRMVSDVLDDDPEERFGPLHYPQGPSDGASRQILGLADFSEFRAGRTARQAVGVLEERQDGFAFRVVLDEAPSSARVATYAVRKRSWDDWWGEVSVTLDGRSVRTVASEAVSLPVLKPGPCPEVWLPTAMGADAPVPREHHSAVWTGSEMIVWGGVGTTPPYFLNSGGRYDPATDSWAPTDTTDPELPEARVNHVAVWTGTEMIVWGGGGDTPPYVLNSGGRYDPATDRWESINATDPDLPTAGQTAVWTGTEMIVWGYDYDDGAPINTGGRYDPATDTWQSINTTDPDVPIARSGRTAVWTGTEMIVWGGFLGRPTYEPTWFNTGGRYSPLTDSWSATRVVGAPAGRRHHTAVWTGREMIVAGGEGWDGTFSTGGRYDPASDSWTIIGSGVERELHTAIGTGSEMIVWGGRSDSELDVPAQGARYNPLIGRWTTTIVTPDTPAPRHYHTAVWTGTEMIVWGGHRHDAVRITNSGGRYRIHPATCGRPPFAAPLP